MLIDIQITAKSYLKKECIHGSGFIITQEPPTGTEAIYIKTFLNPYGNKKWLFF